MRKNILQLLDGKRQKLLVKALQGLITLFVFAVDFPKSKSICGNITERRLHFLLDYFFEIRDRLSPIKCYLKDIVIVVAKDRTVQLELVGYYGRE